MNILVINCGSSSLKYQLINSDTEAVLAKGLCERIGIDGSLLTHTPAGKDKVKIEMPMPNHTVAVKLVIDALTDAGHGVVKSLGGDQCSRTPCSARRGKVCLLRGDQ